MKRWIVPVAGCLLVASLTAACGSGSDSKSTSGSSSSAKPTTLTVFAASSLTQTFTDIGKKFEAAHQGVKVSFDFGGSSDLVAQIQQGAPADVFASADTANMDKAVQAKTVSGKPVNFASNTLEIAVPSSNPAHVTSLNDLTKSSTKVVLCAPQVPCGAAAVKVEQAAGIHIKPVSEEQAVTDVLTKVESGEGDAGLVYVTDVKGAGSSVKGVTFKEAQSAVNVY